MSINIICHVNRSKEKDHKIIFINTEKAFDKTQYLVLIFKMFNKIGRDSYFFNI